MAGITLETAQKHLDAWLEAEMQVTNAQSYTIGKSDRDQKRDRILAAESHNIRELKEKQWKKQSKKICTARLIKVCPIFPVFLGKITYRKYK